MLADPHLMPAVARIHQRSERQEDLSKLIGTYVDVGLLPQLNNRNHQIFFGRRGTGKTHVIKVLEASLLEQPKVCVCYIDCRTLGSTSQFSDPALPMQQRCLSLFRDILLALQDALLQHIAENPTKSSDSALDALGDFGSSVVDGSRQVLSSVVVTENSASSDGSLKAQVSAGSTGVSVGAAADASGSVSGKTTVTEHVATRDKIIFPDLNRFLQQVLKAADCQLYILVDEWSSLPLDIQPYLAEFVKRGLLPIKDVTVKISALEHRSRFVDEEGAGIGFELGADIATAPDLDDYYVYDRNPERLVSVYADILFRHLKAELPENYFEDVLKVTNGDSLASRLFTERAIFAELARASEGVMRDLINIFTLAYFNAHRRGRDSIDKRAVLESARQWFEQDKAQQLDSTLQAVLSRIVKEVIGARRARSFMLPRELERHPVVQRLFDARVLHHMQRGYADKDNPGQRYNIYAIDYGAYVDLLGTAKQPELELIADREVSEEFVVPYDDKRSIRRIILDRAVLEA